MPITFSSRLRAHRVTGALAAPELLLLAVAAVWGASYAVTKPVLGQMPVAAFLALRFALTFAVLAPALRPLRRPGGAAGLAVGGVLGLLLLAIFVCETEGLRRTPAGQAAFLISLCVAFTPWVDWALSGHRPALRLFAATGLCVAGTALLALDGQAPAGHATGAALMLAAALLRACMVCLTRRLASCHALPALSLTAVQCGVVALGASVLALRPGSGGWVPPPASVAFWAAMAFLVLGCTVFAFFAQNHAVQRMPPSRAALLMGSEPLFGALIAVALLGERLDAAGWLGGLLIAGAAAWAGLPRRERPQRPQAQPPSTTSVEPTT
ncbi:MAG: DMT family transporter [Pseudacidovorax sp.]|uniref:DMT family transporter n=1 Tax=Pseudacidovorax sp. TaxID=1934311 RepID=UPI001B50DA9D|nr:DMT family transporter [Pseudacidovorax sp.]MBP6897126.1 DMT family transporter [Pseudacidovorax sp.]